MKYLESAIRFSIKNWMLVLPVFVLTVIAGLISGIGALVQLGSIWSFLANPSSFTMATLFSLMLPMILSVFFGSIAALVAQFIYTPATYGLIDKGIATGSSSLNDLGQALGQNFAKYVMYFLGTLVIGIAGSIAMFLIAALCVLLVIALKGIGAFLVFLIVLAALAAGLVVMVLLSTWFSAMVVDGLDVIAAAKRSFEIGKSNFWTILGIYLLVVVVGGLVAGIFSFIPILGFIIQAAITSATFFVLAAFYLMLYRDKTGSGYIA